MPSPFANQLCGYRADTGLPNTSDAHDPLSVRLGQEMMREMGIPDGQRAKPDPGGDLEVQTTKHLGEHRPDLRILRAQSVRSFLQYGHIGVAADYIKLVKKNTPKRRDFFDQVDSWVDRGGDSRERTRTMRGFRKLLNDEQSAFEAFSEQVTYEDLLKLDITIATEIGTSLPELRIALSAKWSLRTDRAQDCVSQGSKLQAQKRGRMPHYAVITAEPRPAMLKIPSDGPSVDCVYHLDLPALDRALTRMADGNPNWSPKVTFDRLVRQGRLRDYDDLVQQVSEVPQPFEEAIPETLPLTSED